MKDHSPYTFTSQNTLYAWSDEPLRLVTSGIISKSLESWYTLLIYLKQDGRRLYDWCVRYKYLLTLYGKKPQNKTIANKKKTQKENNQTNKQITEKKQQILFHIYLSKKHNKTFSVWNGMKRLRHTTTCYVL